MRVAPWLLPPALAAALACAACGAAVHAVAAGTPSVTLRGHTFSVELAATPEEQEHGLMDRKSMAADHGMLFAFPDAEPRTFWMKDTLIPLDMVFFDARRRAVTVLGDVPPCKADPCPIYPSTEPARYVLELNAGAAAKFGVRKGDVATFINVPPATQ